MNCLRSGYILQTTTDGEITDRIVVFEKAQIKDPTIGEFDEIMIVIPETLIRELAEELEIIEELDEEEDY